MADQKLSALTSASALTGTELVYIVQGGVSYKTTVAAFATFLGAGWTITSPLAIIANNLDLTGYTGKVIALINGGTNLNSFSHFSGITDLILWPTIDITVNDGSNIRLNAPTLSIFGTKEGFIKFFQRSSKMYQTDYIDQYN